MLKKGNGKVLSVAKSVVFAFGALGSSGVFAGNGGTIVFAPDSVAIPVFSGPMLIVISLLFAVIAYRMFRTGRGVNRVAGVAVLVTGVLVASVAGVGQVRSSGLVTPPEGECNTGGELHFDLFLITTFENNCPNDLRVVRIDRECPDILPLVNPLIDQRVAYPDCRQGDVVEASGGCVIDACPKLPPDEV